MIHGTPPPASVATSSPGVDAARDTPTPESEIAETTPHATPLGPAPRFSPSVGEPSLSFGASRVARAVMAALTGLLVGFRPSGAAHRGVVPVRIAKHDDKSSVRVLSRRPLIFAGGADRTTDRPPHVRAASGAAWFGGKLAVVQDDTSFIALVDAKTGLADSVPLPAGPDGKRVFDDSRGNKRFKLDLEACVTLEAASGPLFLALGSGSSSMRETIVTMTAGGDGQPRASAVSAHRLYAALRALSPFSGSELNIEGVVELGGGKLRLFQRGNGAAADGKQPVNATVDLSRDELLAYLAAPETAPVPALDGVVQYDLGKIGRVPLTFNDALKVPGGVLFLASAEDSPDATHDGAVSGTKLGFISDDGGVTCRDLVDEHGRPLASKPEGFVLDPAARGRVLLLTDTDDTTVPAEMLVADVGERT